MRFADRLDDLQEALRLLRVWVYEESLAMPLADAYNLLAKYQED